MSFDLGGIAKLAGQRIGGAIGGPLGSMIGGGYKVARMSTEKGADLQEIGKKVVPSEAFHRPLPEHYAFGQRQHS